ncbi:hypothetical protein EYD10_14911 [Varanus komodoensis]|nr:hypothetical protein EYD10_14911 [Varanus komodoensis]
MARLSAFQLAGLGLSAAAFLCGIICASALTVTQGEFGSQCILYGSVRYNGTLSLSRVSHSSLCYFVSATSVLASILSFAVLFQGIYHGCFGDGQSEHTWFKGSVAIAAAVLFFLLVSGCILRVGMDTLCAAIVQSSAAARQVRGGGSVLVPHQVRARKRMDLSPRGFRNASSAAYLAGTWPGEAPTAHPWDGATAACRAPARKEGALHSPPSGPLGPRGLTTGRPALLSPCSCQEAQRRPWVHPYRAEKFYDNLYTAEAAAWVNFFFWCLMVVLLVLERFIKSSSQPLRSSSARTDEAAPIIGGGPRGP